jgi:hypothetical protein
MGTSQLAFVVYESVQVFYPLNISEISKEVISGIIIWRDKSSEEYQ